MMYATADEFIRDFSKRTKSNYEFIKKSNGKYSVTQLINSLVGLLIIPQQKQFDKITESLISTELYEKLSQCVSKNTYKKELNLSEIVRHMRNSVAHARMEFIAGIPALSSAPIEIHAIKFVDVNTDTHETIDIELTIDLLEDFIKTAGIIFAICMIFAAICFGYVFISIFGASPTGSGSGGSGCRNCGRSPVVFSGFCDDCAEGFMEHLEDVWDDN